MQTLDALAAADVPDRAVGFHAEQVVEKSLKAVLAEREVDYRHSHDIGYLLELAVANGIEPPSELDRSPPSFATSSRSPRLRSWTARRRCGSVGSRSGGRGDWPESPGSEPDRPGG
jgi:hypothetical protein